jgi:hypothetical protein
VWQPQNFCRRAPGEFRLLAHDQIGRPEAAESQQLGQSALGAGQEYVERDGDGLFRLGGLRPSGGYLPVVITDREAAETVPSNDRAADRCRRERDRVPRRLQSPCEWGQRTPVTRADLGGKQDTYLKTPSTPGGK